MPNNETVLHVFPDRGRGWVVRKGENSRILFRSQSKDTALDIARTVARESLPSQLIVHRKDRSTQYSWVYRSRREAV